LREEFGGGGGFSLLDSGDAGGGGDGSAGACAKAQVEINPKIAADSPMIFFMTLPRFCAEVTMGRGDSSY
jgi:hypothetical protein